MKVRWSYISPTGIQTFSHDSDLTAFSITRTPQINQRSGRYVFSTTSLSMEGTIIATGQDNITAACIALELAYSYPGNKWEFLKDDGVLSAHSISSTNLLGYITATVGWPNSLNNEYATQRSFTLNLTAKHLLGAGEVLSYKESFSITGDGTSRRRVTESTTGYPVKQTLANRTGYRAVQQGEAIGSTLRPSAPLPFLTSPILDGDLSSKEAFSGDRFLSMQVMPGIRWNYVFSSPNPIPFFSPGF